MHWSKNSQTCHSQSPITFLYSLICNSPPQIGGMCHATIYEVEGPWSDKKEKKESYIRQYRGFYYNNIASEKQFENNYSVLNKKKL